ncbi:hypothetical protein DM2_2462 [Halorubrum sp. DM2]|nr:hypothetical protein DM2_2462 [Halorubrum sp. DM2]
MRVIKLLLSIQDGDDSIYKQSAVGACRRAPAGRESHARGSRWLSSEAKTASDEAGEA